jgi:hypothetical protein
VLFSTGMWALQLLRRSRLLDELMLRDPADEQGRRCLERLGASPVLQVMMMMMMRMMMLLKKMKMKMMIGRHVMGSWRLVPIAACYTWRDHIVAAWCVDGQGP